MKITHHSTQYFLSVTNKLLFIMYTINMCILYMLIVFSYIVSILF